MFGEEVGSKCRTNGLEADRPDKLSETKLVSLLKQEDEKSRHERYKKKHTVNYRNLAKNKGN